MKRAKQEERVPLLLLVVVAHALLQKKSMQLREIPDRLEWHDQPDFHDPWSLPCSDFVFFEKSKFNRKKTQNLKSNYKITLSRHMNKVFAGNSSKSLRHSNISMKSVNSY